MDNIVIKTDKLNKLTNISILTAQLLVDISQYIQLAVNTEQYVNSGTMEDFEEVNSALMACANSYPTFRQTYDSLSALLISMGYIGVPDNSPTHNTPISKPPKSTTPKSKNNVVSLFDKKPPN